jgi:hypothetical protein
MELMESYAAPFGHAMVSDDHGRDGVAWGLCFCCERFG